MKITSDVHIFDDSLDFTYSLVHIFTIFSNLCIFVHSYSQQLIQRQLPANPAFLLAGLYNISVHKISNQER